jgi:pyruvate-formate lyase-activating enzyme
MNKYSCTSNTAKLLKHLPKLELLQKGVVSPIMVHIMPTNRCQLNCTYCCFKNRQGKSLDMSLEVFKEGIAQFHSLGVRAIELTGGGDPTMWPYLDQGIDFANSLGIAIGMNTNGIDLKKVRNLGALDWVRVSLNTLDYRDTIDLTPLKNVPTTFCYIWNEHAEKNIEKVIKFANEKEIICRVAPDCIKPLFEIEEELDWIKHIFSEDRFKYNEYVFISDFNIDLERKNNNCYIHLVKPCLYTDGNVYACPSAELAVENDAKISEKVKLCRYDEIFEFYDKRVKYPYQFDCSFCKYVKQQELLESLLTPTEFNEFA